MKRKLPFNFTEPNSNSIRKSYVRFLYLLIALFGFSFAGHAQGSVANDYSFAASTAAAYTDLPLGSSTSIVTGTAALPTAVFGITAVTALNVPIGFNFAFNNAFYSTVSVSDNGYITFGSTSPGTGASPISATTAYNGAVSAFGRDLAANAINGTSGTYSADGADIRYATSGTSPNRIFTVEFRNMKRRNITTILDGFLNFQIRLYESNMRIEIVYRNFTSASTTSTPGQVGLRGLTNADFNNRRFGGAANWYPTIAASLNNDSMAITNTLGPNAAGAGVGNDTVFTWTPNCFNPTNLVTNLQVDNTTVNFSWTAPVYLTAGFSGYNWEVRTFGAAGSGASGLFASGSTALTSASVTGLTSGVPYFFYVKSSCGNWIMASAPGATSAGTTITVASTAGLRAGMSVSVTAGVGVFPAGTTISSITNATTFVVSSAPSTALSGGASVITYGYTSAAGATSSGTTITVTSTAGLTVGMSVLVTAGVGVFPSGTTITSVTNATTFVVSAAPTTALSGGATVITYTNFISGTVTPSCLTPVFPYIETFEGVTVPAIPACTSTQAVTGVPMVSRDNSVTPYFGFTSKNLTTNSAAASNTWWFTRSISLTAGNTYRVSYTYGGSRELAFFNQRMKVMIGIPAIAGAPVFGDMSLLLADHPNIKSSPNTFTFNFVSPGTGNYVMGFNGYAAFNQGFLQIDDISLTNPTCSPPTSLSFASITSNSVIVSWTPPATVPPAYEYVIAASTQATATAASSGTTITVASTTGLSAGMTVLVTSGTGLFATGTTIASITNATQFVVSTAPTTPLAIGAVVSAAATPLVTSSISGVSSGPVTTVTGLSSSTRYFIWVRSNCSGDLSIYSTVGTFLTAAPPPTYCTPAPTSVDSQGIVNVTIGSINNTTGAEPGRYGNYTNLTTNIAQNSTVSMSLTYSILGFVGGGYFTRIWIDFNDDGDFFDAGETVFDNGGVELPNGVNNISFTVPLSAPLGPHRMRIGGSDSNNLSQVVLPATSNGPCYTGSWGTFEDYTVFVTVPPPPLTLSSTSTSYCSGGSSPLVTLTAGAASYATFEWNPSSGVTGNSTTGWTFNPTTPGVLTYTLTATQGSGLFLSNTATYTITVFDVPTPIVFTPSTISVCDNVPTALTSTGGIVNGATIIEENFNSSDIFTRVADPGPPVVFGPWIAINNSTGGSRLGPAGSDWTLRTSPYLEPFNSATFISNDSSQFIMSNSDSQGSGGNTNTELISPAFSLAGYTNISLSFWHRYLDLGGTAEVQIANDSDTVVNNGETWTTLVTYNSSVGGNSSFVNAIIDLSAYSGQTNVRIKFKYIDAPYAWWWCIDNFRISGSAPAALVWAPTTGLWLDAACTTTPYTGTPAALVYAKLTSNQLYTATATSLSPPFCNTSSSLTVTVTKAGTAAGNQTLSCGSSTISSNITLTGYVPAIPATITGWQMDDNPSFSSPTTVPGSAGKDTLTPADVTGLASTTYFRAMINGCPTLFSNTVTVTFTNSVSWNGSAWVPGAPGVNDAVTISSGTYTLTSDLAICSLRVSSGAIMNVNPGVTLTVSGPVVISTFGAGGRLNFLDDNTFIGGLGAASLIQNSATTTNSNSGVANYQRWTQTRKFDYTYWSSPLNPMTLINVSPTTLSDKFLRFDSNSYQWTYPNPALTTMTPGVGYAIRGPQAYSTTVLTNYLATFTGTPNNGNYSVALFRPSASNDLNFLGNPYPSAISADAVMDGNVGPLGAAGVGTTFYFWTHNTLYTGGSYVFSDYAAYNRTGGVGTAPGTPTAGGNNQTPNGIISAGQGFMVKAVTAGTMTFTNAMRVSGNNVQFFRSANAGKSRIWLNFTNTAAEAEFKQLLVGYIPNATNNYEDGFDGETIDAGNTVGFYSIVANDNKKLMIQGRALPFDNRDRVALGYKVGSASTYQVALADADGLFSDSSVGVYLEDTQLQLIHDLRQAPYQFVSEPGVFNDRFVLRYNDTMLGVGSSDLSSNEIIVFKQQDDIHVSSAPLIMIDVRVYDVQGRLVMERKNINSQSVVLPGVGLAHQVLMVQVLTAEGKLVSKKIIF